MAITTNVVTGILSKQATSGGVITGDTGDFIPLVDRIIKNKFQLYNRSRQKVTSEIQNLGSIKPFQRYVDSKQLNKQFVVGGMIHELTKNIYSIELFEYDNTTIVNLQG